MTSWKRKLIGEMPIYQATTMSWLPGMIQGFTTRIGGVSTGTYNSLNLGYHNGDNATAVDANRERLAKMLEIEPSQMVYAEQVHGNAVGIVEKASPDPIPSVDALVTRTPGVFLTMLYADCVPIYVVDPLKKVVGLAHSGWRGTAANVVKSMTTVLAEQFDVIPRMCQVAVGPSIAGENYIVGPEVADQFRESFSSTAAISVVPKSEMHATYELYLRRVIFNQLLAAGYRPESIAVCEEDTFKNTRDFFSHRRESLTGNQTGRMAAVIGIRG